jgi:hypothetical protein
MRQVRQDRILFEAGERADSLHLMRLFGFEDGDARSVRRHGRSALGVQQSALVRLHQPLRCQVRNAVHGDREKGRRGRCLVGDFE